MIQSVYIRMIVLLGVAAFLGSCATTPVCEDITAEGNLGSQVNSPWDEYAPVMYGTQNLLFTSNREYDGAGFIDSISQYGEDIYRAQLVNGLYYPPTPVEDPPLNSYGNEGAVSFTSSPITGVITMYFSAFDSKEADPDADLYMCQNKGAGWTRPVKLSEVVNSEYWDSHPAISPDGKVLVFASDRPGGEGGADLYVSYQSASGTWSTPLNLGNKINSRYDDITPMLLDDLSLYFASQAYSPDQTFDILQAQTDARGLWQQPRAMPFPINTQFNEISPSMFGDSLLYASDREGSCGGYDLYVFRVCEEVRVSGRVISNMPIRDDENILVFNEAGALIERIPVVGRSYSTVLASQQQYLLRFESGCYQGDPVEHEVYAPCSIEPMTLNVNFAVPYQAPEQVVVYTGGQIPFFVTGYFKPSTPENVMDLRMQFAYNMVGLDDSTAYIENPGEEYDEYAIGVETALQQITDRILTHMSVLLDECSQGNEHLTIYVDGYADPRDLAPGSRYMGTNVFDEELDVYIYRGTIMTNRVLSVLRAYFTTLHIQEMLSQHPLYERFADRVTFKIRGKGAQVNEFRPYEQMRKIDVFVQVSR